MNLRTLLGDSFREDLTVDELLKLAEGLDYVDPTKVIDLDAYNRLKSANDANSKEAKEWKQKYNSTLGEQEQKALEAQESIESMKAELEALRVENNIMNYTNNFLASGYSEDLAKSTATALANGDMDTVFKNQKKFATQIEKQVKNDALKETKKPQGGSENDTKLTKKDIMNMSLADHTKFARENPDDYKSIMGE